MSVKVRRMVIVAVMLVLVPVIGLAQTSSDEHLKQNGAAINKAFRLEGLTRESFALVEGGTKMEEIPESNRIFVDEEAAQELPRYDIPFRLLGFCSLKGFSGCTRFSGTTRQIRLVPKPVTRAVTVTMVSESEGKTYYFCSAQCKSRIENAPEKLASE